MVRVKVPATSANMGPGFDSLGIAFNLYNEYEFIEINEGVEYEGIPVEFCNKNNIIYTSMIKCFKLGGYIFKGIKIKVNNQDIPISRGLGSSSSCIVAGLIGANNIMGNKFTKDELLKIALDIEGHPDNITPAIFGGMIVAIIDNDMPVYNKIFVKEGIKFIALIPDFKLSTEVAREILPKEIKREACVYNIGRASLMMSCFSTANYKLLKFACDDRIHQQYRKNLVNHYDEVYNKCEELGSIGCYLSGAGPTIIAMILEEDEEFISNMKEFMFLKNINWDVKELLVDNIGAKVIKGD